MGISGSRLAQKATEKVSSDEQGSIPSTPILTPKVFRENLEKEGLDPRSPSKHIARTPIDLLSAAADKLSALTIETGEAPVETPLKRHLILGIDPRSPSVEVQRTPIVVSASPDKHLPLQIRNKNLDKVKKSVLPSTPKAVPPKLLESSPATPRNPSKPDAYKRKSFVLLETNVDFTETDLDTVIKEKYLGKSLQNLSNSDPRSPSTDFLRTPRQISKSSGHVGVEVISNNVDVEEEEEEELIIVQNVGSNNIIKEHTELGLNVDECDSLVKDSKEVSNNDIESEPQGNIDVASSQQASQKTIKSAPVSPPAPNIISVTPKKSKSQPVTPPPPPIINLTADVKELDKKLTNLIYEDDDNDDQVVCTRTVKVNDQCRNPLGPMNGTETVKSAQKLKVSDKPRKTVYVVSKIPVFKEKKIKVQCENTPPKSMRSVKPKMSHWDSKDDTLVI